MPDDRDLAITDLTNQTIELARALAEAEQDRDAFRLMLSEAITRLRARVDDFDHAKALLRQFMGERPTARAHLDPWYPPIDDVTDISPMVRADEIRWR